jgi:hypothetical protein
MAMPGCTALENVALGPLADTSSMTNSDPIVVIPRRWHERPVLPKPTIRIFESRQSATRPTTVVPGLPRNCQKPPFGGSRGNDWVWVEAV